MSGLAAPRARGLAAELRACTAARGSSTSCRTSSSRCSTCVSIGIGVGAYISEMGGTSYVAFLAPGLVAVAAMNGASFEVTYNVFVRLNFEKTYESMLTTPIQPEDVLAGEVLWALTRASIYGGAFLIVIAALGPRAAAALLALPLVPLAGLLFAAIGIAFSLRIPTIELFSFYFTLFLTPLFLFSDVFFPLKERLSGGLALGGGGAAAAAPGAADARTPSTATLVGPALGPRVHAALSRCCSGSQPASSARGCGGERGIASPRRRRESPALRERARERVANRDSRPANVPHFHGAHAALSALHPRGRVDRRRLRERATLSTCPSSRARSFFVPPGARETAVNRSTVRFREILIELKGRAVPLRHASRALRPRLRVHPVARHEVALERAAPRASPARAASRSASAPAAAARPARYSMRRPDCDAVERAAVVDAG